MGIETLVIVGLVMSAAGMAMSAYSSVQQGKNAERVADYKAKVARNEAKVARNQAEFEASQKRRRMRQVKGAQVSAAAKSGVTVSGSISDIMFDTDIDGELSTLTSLYKGQMASAGKMSSATMLEQQGDFAKQMGYVGAGGEVLSGTGSILTSAGAAGGEFGWFSNSGKVPTT